MEKEFYCPNPQCPESEEGPYVKVLNQESVMDEKNLAQMFCPRCKSRLEIRKEENSTPS